MSFDSPAGEGWGEGQSNCVALILTFSPAAFDGSGKPTSGRRDQKANQGSNAKRHAK
jgi:hypothetical protein